MFGTRFKLTWDESVAQFAETLPWQLIAFTIAFGTAIVVWAIIYFGDCCLGSPMYTSYQRKHNEYHKQTRRCGKSIFRLGIVVFAIVVGTFGFWVACNTAGISFWNILFSYGIAAFVMTYSFGSALQSAGAYFLIALTNKVSEDWYVEFIGMPGVEGRITAINILWIEIEYIDPLTKKFRDLFVPTTNFISSIFVRDFGKEESDPAILTQDTATKLTGLRIKKGYNV